MPANLRNKYNQKLSATQRTLYCDEFLLKIKHK